MRVIYMHGFASGPRSKKAVHLAEVLGRSGFEVIVPDLNRPDFEHLRISAMVEHVRELAKDAGPVLLVGSSLGALAALHAAKVTPEVRGLILLAPALSPDERWQAWIGPDGIEAWRQEGTRPFYNFATQSDRPIDFGFYEDLVKYATPPAPRVPVHVIHGEHDEAVPVDVSRKLARAHPELVKLTVVDDDHSLFKHVDLIQREVETLARQVS